MLFYNKLLLMFFWTLCFAILCMVANIICEEFGRSGSCVVAFWVWWRAVSTFS